MTTWMSPTGARLFIPDAWTQWSYHGTLYTRVDLVPPAHRAILQALEAGAMSYTTLLRHLPDLDLRDLQDLRDRGRLTHERPLGSNHAVWALRTSHAQEIL